VCKPDPPIENSQETEREIFPEEVKEIFSEKESSALSKQESGFWSDNFTQFLKVYYIKNVEEEGLNGQV